MVLLRTLVKNMEKQQIRSEILNIRSNMSTEECCRKSHEICSRLIRTELYQKANVIYAYMAFKYEVDLTELIEEALKDQKQIAIPKITDGKMLFYYPEMNQQGEFQTESGYFKIKEPTSDAAKAQEPDVILFPGVAFDRSLNRIGYGKGFYDSYMQTIQKTGVISIGIAYECQLVSEIPTDPHDYRLDYILTEENLYEAGRRD